MDSITLSPAYGRDYRNRKEAEDAFNADKDWRIESIVSGYAGAYACKRELQKGGIKTVELRYARLTKVTIVKL